MLLILAYLHLSRLFGASAAPVAQPFADPLAYDAPIFTRDECSNECSFPGRSVWDIVWSCLATTFAVTWVSVHPNVPFLEEKSSSLLKRRIFLMCLALLAPELMIMWAFKQWRGAVMIREAINKARPKSCVQWTMTHAHFLQMGGFKVNYIEGCDFFCWPRFCYETKKEGIVVQESVLDFEKLRELLQDQLIDFPDTTAEEIEDRSKGDALSKGIALLQISWFIIQLIARAHQRLTITEIELTTAALAGLNSIMYLFWWSKPLDVRCPIVIKTKELERVLAERNEKHNEEETKEIGKDEGGRSENEGGSGEEEGGSCEDEGSSGVDEGGSGVDEGGSGVDEGGSGEDDGGSDKDTGHVRSRSAETWIFSGDEFQLRDYLRESLSWAAQAIISALATHLLHIIGVLLRLLRHRPLEDVQINLEIESRRSIDGPQISSVSRLHFRQAVERIMKTFQLVVTKSFYLPYLLMFLPMDKILRPGGGFNLHGYSDAKDKMHSKPALHLLFDESDMIWIMAMMFYSEDAETTSFLIFSALAGAAFGSIHCAAWHFNFPSTVERILWQTASLSIVGLCLCIVGGIPIRKFVYNKWLNAPSGSKDELFWKSVRRGLEMIPAIVYPLSRLSLLILALISLRDLPDPAFKTVTWTKFIPHV